MPTDLAELNLLTNQVSAKPKQMTTIPALQDRGASIEEIPVQESQERSI